MLRFITARETGILDPLKLRRAETTRRSFSLELSRHRDVERIFKGTINSLDVDLTERRYLLSGGADGYIVIYDVYNQSGNVTHTCPSVGTIALNNKHRHKFSVETVLWYPLDTGMFTSSGTDKLLKVWDTNRLKPADEYEFSGIVYCHHMSPIATKHCLIAVGSESSTVKLVDLKSGSATHTLKGHNKTVMAVRWSPYNEFILASASADNRIYLWDIRNAKGSLFVFDQYNGKMSHKNKGDYIETSHSGAANGLKFTADGLHLVSCGSDNRIHLWNTNTGKNTMVNYGRVTNSGKRSVQFAVSDGSAQDLIYMPHGPNIEVLDMYSGTHLHMLTGHYTNVNCCYFHPDLHELYSAGCDRNILIWVPNTTSDYDDYLRDKARKSSKPAEKTQKFVQRTAITTDNWSSDEDT